MRELSPTTRLTTLIDEHYQFVYRYAYRLSGQTADAEDLTQQTFLAAQRHLDQLREPAAARGWLCAIVRNAYLRNGRRPLSWVPYPEEDVSAAVPELPTEGIDTAELQAALDRLPEEYRTPVILFYFEGSSYKEIAAVMDVPMGTVMSRLSRGKGLLRQLLTEAEDAVPRDTLGSTVVPRTGKSTLAVRR